MDHVYYRVVKTAWIFMIALVSLGGTVAGCWPLAVVNVPLILFAIKNTPSYRERENLCGFVLVFVAFTPWNILWVFRLGYLLFSVSWRHFLITIPFFFMILIALFCVEEIVIGIFIRSIWQNQIPLRFWDEEWSNNE